MFVLFRGLETAITQDFKENTINFAQCFNAATKPSPKIEIKKIAHENFNLSIKAEKKEYFHDINFKDNLVKFYKERVSDYKKPFEKQNHTLGTSFGEDRTNITFVMCLKKEQKEGSHFQKDELDDLLLQTLLFSKIILDKLINEDKNPANDAEKK